KKTRNQRRRWADTPPMRTTTGFGLMGTFLFTLLAACSGDEDHAAEASAEVRSRIISECKARYVCKDLGDSPFEKAVSPRDAGTEGNERMMSSSDGCHAGYLVLTADGRGVRKEWQSGVVTNEYEVTWRVDGERFDVCEGETCVSCTLLDVPAAPGTSSSASNAA